MKKVLLIFLCLSLFSSIKIQAQTKPSWGNWVKVNTSFVDLSISFINVKNCGSNVTLGYSYYRFLNNTYDEHGYVDVSFSYHDCDGVSRKLSQRVLLSKTGIDQAGGYWFMSNGDRITEIRPTSVYLPGKKIWISWDENMVATDQWKKHYGDEVANLVNEFNQNQTTFSDSYSKLNNQISQIKDPTKKAQLQNQLEQYNTRFQQLKQDATQNKSTSNTEELSKNVENIKQLNSNVQSLMSDADNAAANDNSDAQSNDQRNDDANSSSAQSADAARNKAAEEEKAKLKYQQERKEWHAQQREVQAAQETTAATNLVNGAASASDIIGNIQSNLSDRNFFNGSSTHLGINAGLISPNTPMITTTSGGYSNITSPFQLGADIGLTFHPVITDNAALKITGNFVAALDPIAFLSGDGSSTSNTSTDNMDATTISSSTAINYDFGAEVALGAKNVKAIGGYYFRHYGLSYDVSTTTDTYSGDNTTTNNFNENGSIDYNSKRMEFGLRLGDYHGTMVDLIYGLESFTDADRTSKQFPVYKISIWKFSGFKFFAEYGKGIAYGNNYLPWLNDSNSDKKGTYINVGLIYNIDWLWKW